MLITKRSKEKLMQIYLKEAATRTVQKEMTRKDNAGTRRMEEALMMGLERNQGPHDGWNLGREAS